MAISPPSDILLDVARAADPVKVRDATARLARLAADPAATNEGFSKALSMSARPGKGAAVASASAGAKPSQAAQAVADLTAGSVRANAHAKASPYRKFEAVLLQQFVESILPQDDELYGDKTSAGVYRSMMAEQFANQIAAAGGIGIAKAVEKAHPSGPPGKPAPLAFDPTLLAATKSVKT